MECFIEDFAKVAVVPCLRSQCFTDDGTQAYWQHFFLRSERRSRERQRITFFSWALAQAFMFALPERAELYWREIKTERF